MKKIIGLILLLALPVFLSSCLVPESEYQQAVAEREQLKQDLAKAKEENKVLNDAITSVYKERETILAKIAELEKQIEAVSAEKPRPAAETEKPATDTTSRPSEPERASARPEARPEPTPTPTPTPVARPEARPEPIPTPTPAPVARPEPQPSTPAPTPSTTAGSSPSKPAQEVQFYYASPNDTLADVARRAGVPLDKLKELNNITSGEKLKKGQRILIPKR